MRHAWVKLRLHVYVCRKCGTGKVNSESGGVWLSTFHGPRGETVTGPHVPPCEPGPLTQKYLTKYAAEVAAKQSA